MGFNYITKTVFSIDDVVKILNIVKEIFSRDGVFNNFSPADMGHGEHIVKGQLPNLILTKGISFAKFTIFENLPAQQTSIDKLRSLLDNAGSIVNNVNKIHVEVTYEEKNSQQTKRFADQVHVGYRNGKQEYYYSAVGSMVGSDINYRRNFFIQLISDLNLPLQLRDGDNRFSLQHIYNGELFVSMCNIHKKTLLCSNVKCLVSRIIPCFHS